MTFVSSSAMWLSNSKGKVVIEWFGWQVTTSPSFLIISVVFTFFFIYILLSLLLNLYNIPKNTLLKIDTEGYELEVLKGSEKLLKNIDYCIIEVRLENINTYNPSEIINFLYEKNFIFHKILKIYYAKYGIDFIDVLFKKNI